LDDFTHLGFLLQPEFRENFENCDRTKDLEIFTRLSDSSKAKKLLNWTPVVTLEEGIQKIFETGILFEDWENHFTKQDKP
jgi:nucleoside-diphosphate-sugar epimerase